MEQDCCVHYPSFLNLPTYRVVIWTEFYKSRKLYQFFKNDQQPIPGWVSLVFYIFKMSYKDFNKWEKLIQGCFDLYSHQQWDIFHICTEIIFSYLLTFANLTDKNMDLSVVLICISFIVSETECFHMLESHLCFLFTVLLTFNPFSYCQSWSFAY